MNEYAAGASAAIRNRTSELCRRFSLGSPPHWMTPTEAFEWALNGLASKISDGAVSQRELNIWRRRYSEQSSRLGDLQCRMDLRERSIAEEVQFSTQQRVDFERQIESEELRTLAAEEALRRARAELKAANERLTQTLALIAPRAERPSRKRPFFPLSLFAPAAERRPN